jgi:predicted ATP-grasp superfamily ATP-dependent carboligase
MSVAGELVLLAPSARALVASARRGGRRVLALDAFADRDTSAVAQVIRVARGGELDPDAALAVLASLPPTARELIAAAPIEARPELVDQIGRFGRVFNNTRDAIAALKDPGIFPGLLTAAGLRVAETQIESPQTPVGWLRKRRGASGGGHVVRAQLGETRADCFYQREITGVALSLCFLADAERCYPLGINALRSLDIGGAPFHYAGVRALDQEERATYLSDEHIAEIIAGLHRLVRVLALRGLNGIDLIATPDDYAVIEVNPRPPASFALYDDDYAAGLVHWHCQSFERRLLNFAPATPRSYRAIAIEFAMRSLCVPGVFDWPTWCHDLPHGGALLPAAAPLCSVTASDSSSAAAARSLRQRQRELRAVCASWPRVAELAA